MTRNPRLTHAERNRWAFCWWKAMEFAGYGASPWWRWPRDTEEWIHGWTEDGYERASMWLDGAPCEALP